jgi:hypothetical protein
MSQSKEYFKNYYIINREKLCEKRRIYYIINREKICEKRRIKYIINREKKKIIEVPFFLIIRSGRLEKI